MKLVFLKLYRGFFPNRLTGKEEQESRVKRIFPQRRTEIHPKPAFAMCFYCFVPLCQSVKPHETADSQNKISASKQQITDKDIKVLSHACTVKNNMTQLANGIEESVPAYDSGACYVQPFNTAKPGQETLSENTTPLGLLPP
jgi:hypothetical protein